MKRQMFIIFTVALYMIPIILISQDWAKMLVENHQRVDCRDLGYYMVNEIPANSSAITSLFCASDNKIYGGTTGEVAYLFVFDPQKNKVQHLGKVKDQESIHHSIVEDCEGNIYIGTGKNIFEKINLSAKGNTGERFDSLLWSDIKNHYKNYKGGHLYRYNPKKDSLGVKLVGMECDLNDLGIPLENNSVYAMTINPKGNEIYILTYPDGHFIVYNIKDKKFTDMGEIDNKKVYHGPERYWRSLPRSLVTDDSGRVYTSGTNGKIVYYSSQQKKIITTNLKIPSDLYYSQFFSDYAVVEYFTKAKDGLIYGGSSDGYLFSFDTDKMQILNLGKVRESRRLRALTVGKDGKVYLVAGERSASRPCQFYNYDPKTHAFSNLGILIADRSPYYYWRGLQFDSMITGADGTIYIGESDRMSHLYIYIP